MLFVSLSIVYTWFLLFSLFNTRTAATETKGLFMNTKHGGFCLVWLVCLFTFRHCYECLPFSFSIFSCMYTRVFKYPLVYS